MPLLLPREHDKLEALIRRPSTPQQRVLRARIVLAGAAGRNNAQIVDRISPRHVGRVFNMTFGHKVAAVRFTPSGPVSPTSNFWQIAPEARFREIGPGISAIRPLS